MSTTIRVPSGEIDGRTSLDPIEAVMRLRAPVLTSASQRLSATDMTMCLESGSQAKAGGEVAFRVIVTNHSAAAREASCRAVLPSTWGGGATDWSKATIAPKADGEVQLTLRIPATARTARCVVPVDLKYGAWDLPQFTETVVVVG